MSADRTERCETCRFWRPFFTSDRVHPLLKEIDPHGRCKRYPPVAVGQEPHDPPDNPTRFWLHPATYPEDWCGEWQEKAPPAKPVPPPYPSWEEFTRGGRGLSTKIIANLEFSYPSIASVEELIAQSASDLLERRNFGKHSLREVKNRLAEFGLRLRGAHTIDGT